MIDPGTAAIAVLSTVTGVAGYGAMKINANQARVMDETANRLAAEKIEAVQRKLKEATEQLQAKAQRELDAKASEIKDLKRALVEIEDAKKTLTSKLQQATEGERLFASVLVSDFKKAINAFKTKVQPTIDTLDEPRKKAVEKVFDKYTSDTRLKISRGSMQSLYQDLTKAAGQSFMDRAEFDRILTETLKESTSEPATEPGAEPATEPITSTKTPGDSFLDTADNVVLEADMREKELKETDDILAKRLEEAKSDKSTDGKVRIGRIKKAIKSTQQAKDRVVTARNKFKDTRDSYKKDVLNARKTLRARRADPEDKSSAEITLRLPPTDVQESVSNTLDEAGALNVDIKSFLEGKATTIPSSDQSADTETADKGALQNKLARRKQEEFAKNETLGRPPRRRRIPSAPPRSRGTSIGSEGTSGTGDPEQTEPMALAPLDSQPLPNQKKVLPQDPEEEREVFKPALSRKASSSALPNIDEPTIESPKISLANKKLPPVPPVSTRRRSSTLPPSPRKKGGSRLTRKKKLRSRRGTKQTNVRRTRSS